MLGPWLTDDASLELLTALNRELDFDLIAAGTQWDSDRIRDTRIAQTLLFATSFAAGSYASAHGLQPDVVTGHSLGEWTAAALAEVFDPLTGIRLVATRANAMSDACAQHPTTLAAILGGDAAEVEAVYQSFDLSLANNNGPGQVVVGGPIECVEELINNPPDRARVRRLEVAGAFHTPYMQAATRVVGEAVRTACVNDPRVPLVSNLDGQVVNSGADIADRLVTQIESPVRWDSCMRTLATSGVVSAVETCPAGTLLGMCRRNMPELTGYKLDEPTELADTDFDSLLTRSMA